jgi:hypothetical protein
MYNRTLTTDGVMMLVWMSLYQRLGFIKIPLREAELGLARVELQRELKEEL